MKYELKIGTVKLDSPLLSAPLAGISDLAFRTLCRKYGAGLTVSEMINANALVRNNKSTIRMTKTANERPIAIQLFGTKIENIVPAAKYLQDVAKADIIDFNFGCPATDIVKQGAGSALLKRPTKIFEIVKALKENVSVPVTAKIRLGVNAREADPIKIAKLIEEAGADAITVHGRYASQGYTGTADWEQIKLIKQSVNIPVIGNGDITDPQTAKKYLDEGYCDGIMIARGSFGNVRLFKQIKSYILEDKQLPETTWEEKLQDFLEYVKISEDNEDLVFARAKMHAQFFTKGWVGSSKLRNKISLTKNIEEIKSLFEEYKSEILNSEN